MPNAVNIRKMQNCKKPRRTKFPSTNWPNLLFKNFSRFSSEKPKNWNSACRTLEVSLKKKGTTNKQLKLQRSKSKTQIKFILLRKTKRVSTLPLKNKKQKLTRFKKIDKIKRPTAYVLHQKQCTTLSITNM